MSRIWNICATIKIGSERTSESAAYKSHGPIGFAFLRVISWATYCVHLLLSKQMTRFNLPHAGGLRYPSTINGFPKSQTSSFPPGLS
jgi:hypothetical protein